MKILDILNKPWAVEPGTLPQIIDVYRSHIMRGDKLDFKALLGRGDGQELGYDVINGAAVIPVKGPLTKNSSFFSFYFAGTSYGDIRRQLEQALADPDVEQIILDVDSPGGTVDGAFELADFVASIRGQKPIRAFSDGMIASAAYLIAASTDEITISGKTNQVGSIGVIATHVNEAKWYEETLGEVHTEIVSGKYKNITSSTGPLSEEGRESMQEDVDFLFSLFARDVADRRGLDLDAVVGMQARVFIGQQAIDAGLADSVSDMGRILGSVPIIQSKRGIMSEMTLEKFKTEFPDLYQSAVDVGMVSGASQERERILGIQKAAFPGQEELCGNMINEGVGVGEAALRFNAAEKQIREAAAVEIENSAPAPVDVEPAEEVQESDPVAEYNGAIAAKVSGGMKRTDAIKAVVKERPELHKAYLNIIHGGKNG